MSEAISAPSAETATTSGQEADLSAGTDNKGATATKETAPTTPAKFKVKVAGEEREITADEALKDYELRAASYKRMAEAAAKEKEYREIQEQLEKDPIKLLKSKNPKFREMAEKFLADELMEEMMSPEEKARKQLEEENKSYKQKEKERQEAEQAAKDAQESERAAKEIDVELSKALADTFLPKDEFTVSRIATTMINAIKAGVDMSYADAVALTEQQEIANFKKGVATLDGEKLLKYLGEEIAEKIRKADIGRLKSNPRAARPQAAPPVTPAKSASKRSLSDLEEILASKRE